MTHQLARAALSLALALMAALGAAQTAAQDAPRVSLLTCWPGPEFYQLEGHTALLIQEPGRDPYVVNWGVFDFNSPNFAYRFTKGETDYMAAAAPLDHFLYFYGLEGRCVAEQSLNLTPDQARRLVGLVDRNLLPENRVYRYNYVLDNCATRPLALIEQAVGDTLALGSPAAPSATFRAAMRHYHARYPWYQFGIDLALGNAIDRPISAREMSFSPMDLHSQMRRARLPDGRPAVAEERTLTGRPEADSTLGATPWPLTPIAVAIAVQCLTMCAVPLSPRRKIPAWGRAWASTLYAVYGLGGLLLCFLVWVSVHYATSPNWLLLWLNPLCFAGAAAMWVKKPGKLVMSYQMVNFALLIALTALFAAGVQEPNAAFLPLIAADLWCSAACLTRSPLAQRWRK